MSDVCRGDAVGEVQDSRPVGDEADAGSAGDAAEAVGHERGSLLVAHADEFYVVSVVKGIENIQERGAHNAEDVGDAFLPQQFYDRFTGLKSLGQLRHLRPDWARPGLFDTHRSLTYAGKVFSRSAGTF